MIADLHVHTTVSDGSDTFAEALGRARERGVGRVAFTNHDTTRGLYEARALGEALGVDVVGGVEVSAYDYGRGRKVHILGFGLAEESPAVAALCDDTLRRRDAHSHWQLDVLLDAGYDVDVRRALGYAASSTCLYKQHIMAALTDAPHASDEYRTLYRSLFKGDGICAGDIAYPDARDAVRAVVEDGGMAVLAHPGQLDSYDFVGDLVAAGLGGIEQYHPDHGPADYARCAEAAKRYGLALSAGSDYHGAFGDVPSIGFGIPRG